MKKGEDGDDGDDQTYSFLKKVYVNKKSEKLCFC